ncbi:MAG: hypothetical protein WD342_01510, partial [Verrucomicrobiales bacterium]
PADSSPRAGHAFFPTGSSRPGRRISRHILPKLFQTRSGLQQVQVTRVSEGPVAFFWETVEKTIS